MVRFGFGIMATLPATLPAMLSAMLLAGCVPNPAVAPLVPEPRVFVEKDVFDFGEVEIGREVRHRFTVENRGRKPLTLEPLRSECACATTIQPGGTIAAGDTGWVEVAFDTSGVVGDRVRTVTLETNDPEVQELVLSLRGRVLADVRLTPDHVFFGRVPLGVSRSRVVEIDTEPGVAISKVGKESSRFALRIERKKPARSGIRLHVDLHPQHVRGPFDDIVVVTTTSPRQPTIHLQVLGFVE